MAPWDDLISDNISDSTFSSSPNWEDSDFSAGTGHATEPPIDPDHAEWENLSSDIMSTSVVDVIVFVFRAIFGN